MAGRSPHILSPIRMHLIGQNQITLLNNRVSGRAFESQGIVFGYLVESYQLIISIWYNILTMLICRVYSLRFLRLFVEWFVSYFTTITIYFLHHFFVSIPTITQVAVIDFVICSLILFSPQYLLIETDDFHFGSVVLHVFDLGRCFVISLTLLLLPLLTLPPVTASLRLIHFFLLYLFLFKIKLMDFLFFYIVNM